MNHRLNKRIAKSEKFFQISTQAQLLYLLGFAFLDDYGIWTADPHEIWRELFVDHKTIKEKNVFGLLEELTKAKLIVLYAVGSKLYQQYEKFSDFQSFGRGYNKKSVYPDYNRAKSDGSFWEYSGVNGVNGCPAYSLSSSYILNTNSSSKEIDIDKVDLSLEGKEILKCFYSLGFILKDKDLDKWKQWLNELKKDYPNKNLLVNAKKWRDYFETKSPKRYKNSFRNWISKDYADTDKKPEAKVDAIESSSFYKELMRWAGMNGQDDSKCGSIFKSWIRKYGEEVVSKVKNNCSLGNNSYHDFLVEMGKLKEHN